MAEFISSHRVQATSRPFAIAFTRSGDGGKWHKEPSVSKFRKSCENFFRILEGSTASPEELFCFFEQGRKETSRKCIF